MRCTLCIWASLIAFFHGLPELQIRLLPSLGTNHLCTKCGVADSGELRSGLQRVVRQYRLNKACLHSWRQARRSADVRTPRRGHTPYNAADAAWEKPALSP